MRHRKHDDTSGVEICVVIFLTAIGIMGALGGLVSAAIVIVWIVKSIAHFTGVQIQ
jgi:hypothetical protein